MAGAGHRHGHFPAPQHDAPDAARGSRAGGRRRAAVRDVARALYRTKPNRQLKLFGLVLARLDSAADGRLVWAALEDADLAATGATATDSEGLIDLLSQSATAEIAHPLPGGRPPDPAQRPHARRRPRRDRAGRDVGRGRACARRGCDRRGPAAEAQAIVLPVAERLIAGQSPRVTAAGTVELDGDPRRRQAGRAHLARRRGPRPAPQRRQGGWATAARSTPSPRACCRSSWATPRASSSTTWATTRAIAPRSRSGRAPPPTTWTVS